MGLFVNIWSIGTFIISLLLNVPKYPVMYTCYTNNIGYPIFPWSDIPTISKSNPLWLMFHLTISLLLSLVTLSRVVGLVTNDTSQKPYDILYVIHCILIVCNINKFGNFTPFEAFLVNITGIIMLYLLRKRYEPLYFIILCTPVYLEFVSKWKAYVF
jgi:hypothetical protein